MRAARPRPRRPLFAPEVVQTSAMDCGPAALTCLLEGHGLSVSYGRLREACQTDVDGTSIDMLETVAVQLGLHAEQILVPVDHLFGSPVLVEHFRHLKLTNVTVVSPDAGGVERARFFAKKLDAPLAIVDKRRVDIDVSEVMHIIGDVRGRTALIVDDIIDTAGTLVKTADALLGAGATQVYAACTHAVLSGPAVERIAKSPIKEVVATDSVPLNDAGKKIGKIKVLSVADLLARGIRSIHEETSISELFI